MTANKNSAPRRSLLDRVLRRAAKPQPAPPAQFADPMDPHGDGTLREGDPMFDMLMEAFEGGAGYVTGKIDPDGSVTIDSRG